MAADNPRLYTVTLNSQDNDQSRRVNLLAESDEDAVAQCEALETEYVEYRLDEKKTQDRYPLFVTSDTFDRVNAHAQYVHKDSDVAGRFVRAGRVLRGAGPTEVTRDAQARLAIHHQEKPYKVSRVGALDEQMVLASLYGLGWQKQLDGSTGRFVWATDTFKVALTTSTYAPNIDTHDFFNDVTNEVVGTGYTGGGVTLASKTSTYDTASDQVRLDAADVQWTTSTITGRYAVVWYDTAGASGTDPLLGLVNFESDVSTTAGTFQITWDATGLMSFDLT